MSYRAPSRKIIAELAAAGGWQDEDVVVAGTDAREDAMRISREQASVSAPLVRSWLLIKDRQGQRRLKVVRDFVSRDGFLFTA